MYNKAMFNIFCKVMQNISLHGVVKYSHLGKLNTYNKVMLNTFYKVILNLCYNVILNIDFKMNLNIYNMVYYLQVYTKY